MAPVIASGATWTARVSQAATSFVPTSKDVKVFGQKIHYLEAGTGPVLILLHGLGGDASNWSYNIIPLSQKFHVIVPDQLGFGASDKPFTNYRVATYVAFLDKFLSELKIERASLVGNSLGGWIAASYALAHPEKVERLVLVDAAGFAPPKDFDLNSLSGLNPSTREGTRALIGLVFYNKQFSSDLFVDAFLEKRLAAGDGYTIQSLVESIKRGEDFLDNRLARLKQPTLVIWGKEDGLIKLSDGERFQREIPGARLVVYEGCGHVPQLEKAAEFNAEVLKFVSMPNQVYPSSPPYQQNPK
jgi:pimeloyl-ACP methyl ester carboxylesterase